jgi:hypothetical protein
MPQQVGKFDFSGIPAAGQQPQGGDDAAFRRWYMEQSKRHGLSPDPDDPKQMYDYRAAFRAGVQPDATGHWPSDFKKAGHPNEIVGGFNTRTGERAPGTPQASESELVRLGWDPATAKRMSAPQEFDFTGVQRQAAPEHPHARAFRVLTDFMTGAAKGAGETAVNLGGLLHQVPGVSAGVDMLYGSPGLSQASFAPESPIRTDLQATNTSQAVGKGTERVAEFILPSARAEQFATSIATHLPRGARVLPHMAAQGATGAAVATAQGADPMTAGITGAIAPAAVRGVVGAARAIGNQAEPLVRAAIKPTVTAMRQVAGGNRAGLDQKASQLVRFIIDNKVTTAERAQSIFDDAERELQRLLTSRNPPTDAAMRADRYLKALERSASKQGLPADDVAAIRNAAADLLEGSMGKDVVTMVSMPHPTLVDQFGKPLMVQVPHTVRQLRTDVPAAEVMDSARASSQWQTRKQWGEQKGATTEAKKTVERAQRDAVKVAVPEAKNLLKTESQAIQSRDVLDRMAFRQANREAVSFPAQVTGTAEVLSGRVPVMAAASNWLRNNGMKAGIYVDALKRAVETGNAQNAAWALERLGVGLPPAVAGAR